MTALFIEIGQASLKIRSSDAGMEFPLERQPNGQLTSLCQERLTLSLQGFLKRQNWQSRRRALCAIGARGVSLRRMILPAASGDQTKRLVRLQIESEFPLSPDELAWGYLPLPSPAEPGRQEVLVAAVKKEIIEEYTQILTGCGLAPEFTLAALARASLFPAGTGAYAVLDLGREQSELLSFADGIPSSIRILPSGGENLTRAIAEKLQISHDEAEKQKIEAEQKPVSSAETPVQKAMLPAINDLALDIRLPWIGRKLYLTGKSARVRDLAPQLAQSLGGQIPCERLELPAGDGASPAILGLQKLSQTGGRLLLLNGTKTEKAGPAVSWQWAAAAGAMAFLLVCFSYLEALAFNPYYTKKVETIKAGTNQLAAIDREWSFLQHLKQNQPPYLDTLYLIANGAAQGTKIDSIAMNRRGDISLRGSMATGQQVTDFRSKLIASGLFSTVSVEEQTPSPDHQKFTVRITAQWKPVAIRKPIMVAELPKEVVQMQPHNEEFTFDPPGYVRPPMPPPPPDVPKMPAAVETPPDGLPPGFQLPPGVKLPPGARVKTSSKKTSETKSSSDGEGDK